MEFYYVNSKGTKIDLTKPPFIGEISNDLLSYKWTYITQGQAVQKIVKFEKAMVSKKFHVLITGKGEDDYMNYVEKFLQLTDVDVDNLTMGRLYVDEYYLECYIIQSGKPKRYLGTTKTLVELTIICENGNWQKDRTWKIRRNSDTPSELPDAYTANGIQYPYDYMYDYSAPFDSNFLANESYMATDFEMTFYGAMDAPNITIGGNVYEINYPIGSGDYIKINSQKKTAILYKNNGQQINVFKYRNKDNYIFEKINGGGNIILFDKASANREIKIDITLFYERSEPKWSKGIWI